MSCSKAAAKLQLTEVCHNTRTRLLGRWPKRCGGRTIQQCTEGAGCLHKLLSALPPVELLLPSKDLLLLLQQGLRRGSCPPKTAPG